MLVEFVSALVSARAAGAADRWSCRVRCWPPPGSSRRRTQEPAACAGQRRQEELERMTPRRSCENSHDPDDPDAKGRFRAAAERLLSAEIRVGWLQAANGQGSGGLAKLGPIAVVVAAAFAGNYRPAPLSRSTCSPSAPSGASTAWSTSASACRASAAQSPAASPSSTPQQTRSRSRRLQAVPHSRPSRKEMTTPAS